VNNSKISRLIEISDINYNRTAIAQKPKQFLNREGVLGSKKLYDSFGIIAIMNSCSFIFTA